MEKANPGIDFQCPAASGHESGYSTKNLEPGPVPDFLLSKKKENIIAKKHLLCPIAPKPNPKSRLAIERNTHTEISEPSQLGPPSVSPPAATTHRHRWSVDHTSSPLRTSYLPRSIIFISRKTQQTQSSPSFGHLLNGNHRTIASAIIVGLTPLFVTLSAATSPSQPWPTRYYLFFGCFFKTKWWNWVIDIIIVRCYIYMLNVFLGCYGCMIIFN